MIPYLHLNHKSHSTCLCLPVSQSVSQSVSHITTLTHCACQGSYNIPSHSTARHSTAQHTTPHHTHDMVQQQQQRHPQQGCCRPLCGPYSSIKTRECCAPATQLPLNPTPATHPWSRAPERGATDGTAALLPALPLLRLRLLLAVLLVRRG